MRTNSSARGGILNENGGGEVITGANRNSVSDEVTSGVRNSATLVTGKAKSVVGRGAGDRRV